MEFTLELRNDLTRLQYENGEIFSKDTVQELLFKHEITDINPEDISIYNSNSKDFFGEQGSPSGFDGAAIHVYNKDDKINEIYYIARGTELSQTEDIIYNAIGVTAGASNDQILDATRFYEHVEKKLSEKLPNEERSTLERFGDGHSLGGHIIVSLALINKEFSNVRGLNDAPVNLKQMANIDADFNRFLISQAETSNIEKLPDDQLELHAREFYADEAQNITHVRVKGEPLYPQLIPNTFYAGNKIQYVGDMNTPEFPNLFEADSGNRGIFHNLFMPGKPIFDKFVYNQSLNAAMNFLGYVGKNNSVGDVHNKLVESKSQAVGIYNGLPPNQRIQLGIGTGAAMVVGGFGVLSNSAFVNKAWDIYSAREQFDLHSISTLIEQYKTGEITTYHLEPGTSTHILVNQDILYSALLSLETALEEKREAVQELLSYREWEVPELAFEYREKLNGFMSNKEANWAAFLSEAGHSYSKNALYKPTGVTFRREFDPLSHQVDENLDHMIELYQQDSRELESIIESYKATIDVLFDTDVALAARIR
ncbi:MULTISPECIES: DUF6792 domain-containing protein [Bacillaceae]|uniref:DUF6792 domain-containing protein n=1 Tax=Alkalicoccobacillus plakortidis TaxID=444060 RepID=A0A9D5I1U5_9BACI|nr:MULTISPECIES: DUF6792 domain-containing protein [Bacillaceae]KQL56991.1 hypothetical protein AN965_11055 [Alkalicoccobacillus plakortidis]